MIRLSVRPRNLNVAILSVPISEDALKIFTLNPIVAIVAAWDNIGHVTM